MTLKEYKSKRDFSKTPEPEGKNENVGHSKDVVSGRFVVQEHHASHLHYDFRLEMDGILKSWAVPKGIPERPKEKRLAVHVEDHPLDYIDFAGTIPEGQYGAGEVKIFDSGLYSLLKNKPNEIEFVLKGDKLEGEYVLVKTKLGGKENNWLLIKK